ncbi:MAG: transporter substrate-binding domain-containing protein [Mycobacterium sp.]
MLARLRSVVSVVFLVATLAGLPGLSPTAHAAPRMINLATYDLAPFVMTHDGVKSGFTIDLLEEIHKRTGVDYNLVDGDTAAGLLKAVAEGRAEAAACAISITSERAERFDFSQPIMKAGLQIAIPATALEHTQPGMRDFLKLLFSQTMASWLIAALVLTIVPAHIIWLLERHHDDDTVSRSYFPGIFQSFGWGLGMLAASPDDAPRHWQTRALSLVWAFVSVIFVAYFTATLTANLTVDKFESKINSATDLIGRRVCTVADTTSTTHLNKIGVDYTGMRDIEGCYTGLQAGKFDAIVFDAPVLQYYVLHQGAGVATIAGPVFHDEDYGILFPLGSRLRREFDDALLGIRESGDFDLIKQKWFD